MPKMISVLLLTALYGPLLLSSAAEPASPTVMPEHYSLVLTPDFEKNLFTYLWLVALTGGAMLVIYAGACASLLLLRRRQPQAEAMRIPFGRGFAVIGIFISVAVASRLHARGALLMGITAIIAIANWWWAKRRDVQKQRALQAVIAAAAE